MKKESILTLTKAYIDDYHRLEVFERMGLYIEDDYGLNKAVEKVFDKEVNPYYADAIISLINDGFVEFTDGTICTTAEQIYDKYTENKKRSNV